MSVSHTTRLSSGKPMPIGYGDFRPYDGHLWARARLAYATPEPPQRMLRRAGETSRSRGQHAIVLVAIARVISISALLVYIVIGALGCQSSSIRIGADVFALVNDLRSSDVTTRQRAYNTIRYRLYFSEFTESDLSVLLDAADDPNPFVRGAIIHVLGSFPHEVTNDLAIPVLSNAIGDPMADIRLSALYALKTRKIAEEMAVRAMGNRLLVEEEPNIRNRILDYLESIGVAASPASHGLKHIRDSDPDEYLRQFASHILATCGPCAR